jgi:phenylacetate-CoA ligase
MLAALHRGFSRHVFFPWVVEGPWSGARREYARHLATARAAFEGPQPDVLGLLRARARWAGRNVPYYREAFRDAGFDPERDFDLAEWRRLPPLEKKVLRERPDDLLPAGTRRDLLVPNATGGSTGEPVRLLLDPSAMAWRTAAQEWAYSQVGVQAGDRTALLWGSQVEPGVRPTLRNRVVRVLANRMLLDCFRLSDAILDDYHERLSAFRPEVLQCYATALVLLAARLKARGIRPSYPTRCCLTGAERLYPDQRRKVEEVFPVPVFESYGSRDCGAMAIQLVPGGPLRVASRLVLLEPWGPDVPNAGREILVTHLHGGGTVFLRYRIGDLAWFPQGSEDSVIEEIGGVTGRVLDHVRLPGGRLVHGTEFPHFLKDFDIVEYQVVQERADRVRVDLVAGPRLAPADLDRIRRVLGASLAGTIVDVRTVDRVERTAGGKLRPVVSLVNEEAR